MLWQKHVTSRLPAILTALAEEATEGNLTAIKLVLEIEGISKEAINPQEDNYLRIVGECCDSIENLLIPEPMSTSELQRVCTP